MYMHPEMNRLIAAQRIAELHAQADIDRLALSARRARQAEPAGVARWRWLRLRRLAPVRPAVSYPAPRNA
jgi:hypothetical protein